jgi:thiol-disulfide isomerase/thioredoxin
MKLYHIPLILLLLCTFESTVIAQTPLEEAVNFHVKTTSGQTIVLFDKLTEGNIVVIDFFSTSCGPCQTYAPAFQAAYEKFGFNDLNTFFIGINYNSDNQSVEFFDSIFGLTYPSVSGLQGGGNIVFEAFQVVSWPTVIVITPDGMIANQYVWPPTEENVSDAVVQAGGILLGMESASEDLSNTLRVYPNPVSQNSGVSISSSNHLLQITISDLSGRVVAGRKANENGEAIQYSGELLLLKPGMYLVSAVDINNRQLTHKLVVR